jgi:hypothetical protein
MSFFKIAESFSRDTQRITFIDDYCNVIFPVSGRACDDPPTMNE